MALKWGNGDGPDLPRRDREAGYRKIDEQRAAEAKTEHDTFDVPQRENRGHPDGYRNNR